MHLHDFECFYLHKFEFILKFCGQKLTKNIRILIEIEGNDISVT